jgi:hypothetical protein
VGYHVYTVRGPKVRVDYFNAVEQHASGYARFVEGPWKATYGLGTSSIDPHTRTAGT